MDLRIYGLSIAQTPEFENLRYVGENLNSSHRGFMHTLFNKYSAVFSNGETSAVPVPSRGPPPPSMNSDGAASNITHSETTRIPPTILSFDADPGTSNAAGQSHEDTEEAEQGGDCTVLEFVLGEGKPNENDSEAPIGVSKQKAESGFCYIYASIDDEDVCPTCLEGDQSVMFSSNFLIV
ncbi:unnamed protein product [Dovyalis caffra]|uniref:Uncharacterized protein n=1 Tax=Dovyalis caffra TaxID=77055 RepID=A0AAV1QY77_9ROSI|nr:unnamed protein product [Dovyalis caffra]